MDGQENALLLVLNCGSSSIKFALFDAAVQPLPRTPLWQGRVQGIGGPAPAYVEPGAPAVPVTLDAVHPHTAALADIRERVADHIGRQHPGRAIGLVVHRVVHGGGKYFAPVRVDAAVIAELRELIPLAPLHQPFPLKAMSLLLEQNPDLPQVACFDTAFHQTIPPVEQALPLPAAFSARGLRRYGFHGLSYHYMAEILPERHGASARGRTIVAHLGSGASLCAMHNLQSVATTMGFSALDGLMMGTRTGAIDPGVLLYLMEVENLSVAELGELLYAKSGLLGASGLSAEPRVLVQHEDEASETGARARLAMDLYVRRIVREIGALVAVLGGLDLLVFTAGVGENCDYVRERVCRDLAYLGVEIDVAANAGHAAVISTPSSKVIVGVEPTNEEWIAARSACQLMRC